MGVGGTKNRKRGMQCWRHSPPAATGVALERGTGGVTTGSIDSEKAYLITQQEEKAQNKHVLITPFHFAITLWGHGKM